MAELVDTARQRGLAATMKLIAYTDGNVTEAAFDAVNPAFTIEVSGVDSTVEIEEYEQKDSYGRKSKWEGSRYVNFTMQVLEKRPEVVALICGLDPTGVTAAAGYDSIGIDGVQNTVYWSAYIYGEFATDDAFGYVVRKGHFKADALPSIKLDSAPASCTFEVDPVDSGASVDVIGKTIV